VFSAVCYAVGPPGSSEKLTQSAVPFKFGALRKKTAHKESDLNTRLLQIPKMIENTDEQLDRLPFMTKVQLSPSYEF
jgi:hypothetical protein